MSGPLHIPAYKVQHAKRAVTAAIIGLQSLKHAAAVQYRKQPKGIRFLTIFVIFCVSLAGWSLAAKIAAQSQNPHADLLNRAKQGNRTFSPTATQWATFTIAPVEERIFRPEHITEGKVAVNEDRSTLIFSPYSGRVTKLLIKPGDTVARGQMLFVVEAADMVSAQNDFIAALTGMNKARAQLNVADAAERRHRDLYNDRAVALRELEQAHAALVSAQNDVRSAETALQAGRNRLRLFGKTEEEITTFEQTGKISPETPIYAPIDGTIVQRKVGPGQYVNAGTSDPVFVVGDLSTVWLIAYVRETEASKIHIGQQISFAVLTDPNNRFIGNISYVASSLDPATRRLLVRATIQNPRGALKPEMYATVSIYIDEGDLAPAVPRSAVIYEGGAARVWVAGSDHSLAVRNIVPGIADGDMVQVLDGLRVGEEVVTKGNLFIDRAVAGS